MTVAGKLLITKFVLRTSLINIEFVLDTSIMDRSMTMTVRAGWDLETLQKVRVQTLGILEWSLADRER